MPIRSWNNTSGLHVSNCENKYWPSRHNFRGHGRWLAYIPGPSWTLNSNAVRMMVNKMYYIAVFGGKSVFEYSGSPLLPEWGGAAHSWRWHNCLVSPDGEAWRNECIFETKVPASTWAQFPKYITGLHTTPRARERFAVACVVGHMHLYCRINDLYWLVLGPYWSCNTYVSASESQYKLGNTQYKHGTHNTYVITNAIRTNYERVGMYWPFTTS